MILMTHKGYDIEVSINGKFTAAVSEYEVSENTLEAAQARIDQLVNKGVKKAQLALAVVAYVKVSTGKYGGEGDVIEIRELTLTGIHRQHRGLQFEPKLKENESALFVLPATPRNRAIIERDIEAAKAAKAARSAMGSRDLTSKKFTGYGRIEPDEYSGILAQVEKYYAAIVAEEAP